MLRLTLRALLNIYFFELSPCSLSYLKLQKLAEKVSSTEKTVADILLPVLYYGTTQTIMQILLDWSVMPEIVRHTQNHGTSFRDLIFHFGRTWCYYIHRERMKQRGLLN